MSKEDARKELSAIMNLAIDARIEQLLRDGRVMIDRHEDLAPKKRKSFGDYTWRELKTKK